MGGFELRNPCLSAKLPSIKLWWYLGIMKKLILCMYLCFWSSLSWSNCTEGDCSNGTGNYTQSSSDRTPPIFSLHMGKFCSNRPYDCMDNEIVTGHLLNTFLYEFYLEVEDIFYSRGFDKAEFEYCDRLGCLVEGVSVKNSKYKITGAFPRKRDYFSAFGGVNRNSGVYFSHPLTEKQAGEKCSVLLRGGNKISTKARRAIEKGETSIWNLKSNYYEKYSLRYVEYLSRINALDRKENPLPSECWLTYRSKRIIFESKESLI